MKPKQSSKWWPIMTTEVYPRFLRLAAGKLIAVVVTLAEYFNILIDTRHMNVNIYTRCSHQLHGSTSPWHGHLRSQSNSFTMLLNVYWYKSLPLPLYPLNLRLPRTRRGGCGISSIVGGRLGRKPRRADLDTSTLRYIALHCVTLLWHCVTLRSVGAYPIWLGTLPSIRNTFFFAVLK